MIVLLPCHHCEFRAHPFGTRKTISLRKITSSSRLLTLVRRVQCDAQAELSRDLDGQVGGGRRRPSIRSAGFGESRRCACARTADLPPTKMDPDGRGFVRRRREEFHDTPPLCESNPMPRFRRAAELAGRLFRRPQKASGFVLLPPPPLLSSHHATERSCSCCCSCCCCCGCCRSRSSREEDVGVSPSTFPRSARDGLAQMAHKHEDSFVRPLGKGW
jgi:hypothetical protein